MEVGGTLTGYQGKNLASKARQLWLWGLGGCRGARGGDKGGIWGDFVFFRLNFPLVYPNLAM